MQEYKFTAPVEGLHFAPECAYPACARSFVPKRPGQKYHSQKCAIRHTTERRAGFRPTALTDDELALAEEYLIELKLSDGLVVQLVPDEAADGRGMVRAKESENPDWYKRFISEYQRTRYRRKRGVTGKLRPRTRRTPNHYTYIDRRVALRVLERIVYDRTASEVYGGRLEDFIRREHARLAIAATTEFDFDGPLI